jgi:N-acyl-D-amino-acid deacylase
MRRQWTIGSILLFAGACATAPPTYDVVIRNGTIYDGSGGYGIGGDLAIRGDRIAAIGILPGRGKVEIDAHGMAIAPGFINVMSQAQESLIIDGRGMSDLKQGVTTEIFGEGESMGPLSPAMKDEFRQYQGDLKYDVDWTTLGEYLNWLQKRGVSPNIGSFIGAATPRVNVLGRANRAPTPAELEQMRALVRQAMQEGAFGIASALIYAPGAYATTDELVAMSKEAAPFGGMYISHLRSEGNRLVEAVDELISISKQAGVAGEIYHLKAAGEANWPKMNDVIKRVNDARASGLRITADMYTYSAGATGLDAAMPPWVQAGGLEEWRKRLQDPPTRAKVLAEMRSPDASWESLLRLAGSPDRVLFTGFRSEALKPLTGKTLAQVAKARGKSPEDTVIDLVIEDDSRVETIYFLMSEDNIKKEIAQPWVSFGSDAAALAPEGAFLKSSTHPRAYGNFANLLGKYVRDEQVISLSEAIHRMTGLPASNLGLAERGLLKAGNYADVVVFNPVTIAAPATYADPRQYAVGVLDVFINGQHVIRKGEHTGAKPGMVVKRKG